jgi:hypothetical protein
MGLTKILDQKQGKFISLAIDDGNPIAPPDATPMDEQDSGPDVPHAFTDNPDKPGKCLICDHPEDNEVHNGPDGEPFDADDNSAPTNTGYQGPTAPPIQASVVTDQLVSLAKGVNPFAKHKFMAKGKQSAGKSASDNSAPSGACATCGKGPGAAVHQNATGQPIGATGGKMTGEQWSQTTHPNETATEKILRLTGK